MILPSMPSLLVSASAAIFLFLGTLHLVLTFHGPKLLPRDRDLPQKMRDSTLVISTQTTVWRAWIGFNGSHSLGAMLYGLVYGYFALAAPALLFGSVFLQAVGFGLQAGYLVLAQRYWFRVPRNGVALATLCYVAALIVARV